MEIQTVPMSVQPVRGLCRAELLPKYLETRRHKRFLLSDRHILLSILCMGMTLIANQFRGRLLLQATYVPESVPEGLANEFLDGVVEDLMGLG